jgi:hypothetical protein
LSAPIAAVPRRVNIQPGRRIHACGERQQVGFVTGVQRERNVRTPAPSRRQVPASESGPEFAIPGFGSRAGSLPADSRPSSQSARASGQQPADRRVIASAPPVRSTSIGVTLGALFRKRSRSRWNRTVHDQRCAQTIQFNLFWQPLTPKQKRPLARKFALSASVYECCIRYN